MIPPIILTPEAEADLEAAARWYEQRSARRGVDLVAQVFAALGRIVAHPELYPTVHVDMRRAQVKQFPYGVFYLRRGPTIQVVGIFHNRRDPTAWQNRAET